MAANNDLSGIGYLSFSDDVIELVQSQIQTLSQTLEPLTNEAIDWLSQLTPETVIFLVVYYGLPSIAALFLGRTVATILLRAFGLSHPNHYRFWPRLPWRVVYKNWSAFSLWFEQVFKYGKQATGDFSSALTTLSLMYKPNTIFLGRAYAWGFGLLQPIGVRVTRHVFCYAMTGGGKTTWLITMLSCWRGSAWLIDPKGQVTEALRRNDKRQWVVLAPYEPDTTDFFNPLDDIKTAIVREGQGAEVKWAVRVAQALIVTPAGSKQPYFTDTSRAFVVGLILHILTFHEEQDHHLGFMRELIVHGYRVLDDDGKLDSTPKESRELLYKLMRENPACGGAIAGGVAVFASASGETSGNLLSTLQEQTKWLDLPSVAYLLSKTTRPISDLKTRDDVVFSFCAPVLSIREELQPLLRLLTNLTAYTFESVKKKKGQCLTIIDELQAQGYNATIEVVLPVGRSYGQTFVGIAQDIEGMKNAYPNTYKAFTGNADVVLWMGSNHPTNLEFLSQTLGKKSHVSKDRRTRKKSYREVPVIDPDQAGRLLESDSGNIIVTRAGRRALRLKNDPYYKALPVTKYDADPDHGDSFLRAIIRFFLNRKPNVKKK
jgi:type IV secretory pathway TraG/TraD family ATPase VirD4